MLVFEKTGTCAILLSGSLDTHVVPQLHEKMKAITAGRRYNFIVDLDGLTYISSAGLGFLMYLYKIKQDSIYLSHPRPAILKPFNLLDIRSLFNYYQAVDDLHKKAGMPEVAVKSIREEKNSLRVMQPRKRGLEILAEYLDQENDLLEIRRMTPYIHEAEHKEKFTLPAEEKYAGVLYVFLDRIFGGEGGYDWKTINEDTVELVARELMANAVKHGYGYQKGGMVEVGYKADQTKLTISFTDHGRGYMPDSERDNEIPPAGLALLKKIFDKITISEAPQIKAEGLVLGPGTTVRMVKYYKSEART